MASYDGNQSIRIRSKNYQEGFNNITQTIWLPEIDMSNIYYPVNPPNQDFELCFNFAYAKRLPYLDQFGNSVIQDMLTISTRHNNGDNSGFWQDRAILSADDLTVNTNIYFNEYMPTDTSDWQEKCIQLNAAAYNQATTSLLIYFEFQGKGYLQNDTLITTSVGGDYISNNLGGNWLYIDNLRIGFSEDIETRNHSAPINNSMYDNRIFDLFGREYHDTNSLKSGIYFKNGQLVFIKGTL